MKHLFIINPLSEKIRGRVSVIVGEIEHFFESNSQIEYDIHITRWARDAEGFVRHYVAEADQIIRVHVFGGSGTLFEVVNGVIHTPNVQIAAYPMGRSNYFLRYFGNDKLHLFSSIRNQVFSGVTPIDAIRCGSNYGVSHGLVGIEAISGMDGTYMIEKTHLPTDFCYFYSVTKNALGKNSSQSYRILLDDKVLDGDYITMMIANVPCYGKRMCPAPDAHPNDGRFEVYTVKNVSKRKRLSVIPKYAKGNYHRFPDIISHYSGSKISISSDTVMCMSVDGETFYDSSVEYEIIPYAIDLACPTGIDVLKLPRMYGRPETAPA